MLDIDKCEKRPKFSILIPLFNDSSYIEKSLNSALASDSDEFEVIVCDDCSDDNSFALVEKFNDPRIKIFQSKNRLGAIGNWLNCLNKASGTWVQFLGSDDFYEEGSIDTILNSLDEERATYTLPLKCFSDRTKEIIDVQATPEKINNIFQKNGLYSWRGILKNINHDELSMTIYPRELVFIFQKLMHQSSNSAWIYWVIAIFYNAKIVPLSGGAIMKRYDHVGDRAQWGEVNSAKKNVTGINFIGFFGDVYNSFVLASHFRDLSMLIDLWFRNQYHETRMGGLYGLMSRDTRYFRPGSLISFFLAPILIVSKKFKDGLNT